MRFIGVSTSCHNGLNLPVKGFGLGGKGKGLLTERRFAICVQLGNAAARRGDLIKHFVEFAPAVRKRGPKLAMIMAKFHTMSEILS